MSRYDGYREDMESIECADACIKVMKSWMHKEAKDFKVIIKREGTVFDMEFKPAISELNVDSIANFVKGFKQGFKAKTITRKSMEEKHERIKPESPRNRLRARSLASNRRADNDPTR